MSDADRSLEAAADLESEDVVSVATLNDEIAEVIENKVQLQHDYIVGDVSDASEANGHVHFDLVYDDASIHCVLFGFRRDGTSVDPEEEKQVAVHGELSYYEARGSCSILVTDVVEVGESQYSRVYEQNRQALEADGLLDDDRKQPLPELPKTVGIVTSADSNARTDAVTAIHSRYPDVDIVVEDATVQGPNALQEMMGAVTALDRDAAVDVIVMTRGGGADKTLRVFNESPLCRVIAGTDTPCVVGIGHEDDHTLADEVADERVMTPTHAGEIVPEKTTLVGDTRELEKTLDTAYEAAVEARLSAYALKLDNAYRAVVTSSLQELEARLDHTTERAIDRRVVELQTDLDQAYHTLEQQKKHKEKLESTVEAVREETTAEAEAEVVATRRRYRTALVILTLFLLGLIIAHLYL